MEETIEEYIESIDYINDDIEEPKPDYSNSSALDVYLYSTDSRLDRAAHDLCGDIGYTLDRAIIHMKVVLLNLYWANHLSAERWLGYSRDNNRYGIPFRYNKQRIEIHPLVKVVNGLISLEYVVKKTGFFDRAVKEGKCTRIMATSKLIDLLEKEYGFTIDIIGRYPDEEVIYLKDEQKRLVNYEDSTTTNEMRRFLNEYNEFIQKTYIDIDYMGYQHTRRLTGNWRQYADMLPTHLYFDLTRRKLKRVFNSGSLKLGGRFYGGFWSEMPSELRLRLMIDCEKVVECDYSGIHIQLLYNSIGIDYGRQKEDPYAIPEYPETKEFRNLFKKLLLASINAKTRQLARSALQKDINFNRADYPDEIPNLLTVIDDFCTYHEPIKKYLCSGAGLSLMYQDSQIAELVLKEMTSKTIPILPVHDSFICPKRYSDDLIEAMTRAYRKVIGYKLAKRTITVNIKEPDEWQRIPNPLFDDGDYFFDPTHSEDTELITHILKVEGYPLDDPEDGNQQAPKIVAPHKLYISIPITYDTGPSTQT